MSDMREVRDDQGYYSDPMNSTFAQSTQLQYSDLMNSTFARDLEFPFSSPSEARWIDDNQEPFTDRRWNTYCDQQETRRSMDQTGLCMCEEKECYSEDGFCYAAGNYMMHLWNQKKSFGSSSPPQNFRNYFSVANSEVSLMFQTALIRRIIRPPTSSNRQLSDGDLPTVPRICISAQGTLGIILSHAILVELSLNFNVRICQLGASASALNTNERLAAIHHPAGDFLLNDDYLYANFSFGTRLRLLPDGIRHRPYIPGEDHSSPNNESRCYWNLNDKGLFWEEIHITDATKDPFGDFLPIADQSVPVFFNEAYLPPDPNDDHLLFDLISRARVVPSFSKQTVTIWIGDLKIRQDLQNGETQVQRNKSFLSLKPSTGEITIKTETATMSVNGWDRISLECGSDQQVLTSTNCLTMNRGRNKKVTFDLWGRLLSMDGFQMTTDESDA